MNTKFRDNSKLERDMTYKSVYECNNLSTGSKWISIPMLTMQLFVFSCQVSLHYAIDYKLSTFTEALSLDLDLKTRSR